MLYTQFQANSRQQTEINRLNELKGVNIATINSLKLEHSNKEKQIKLLNERIASNNTKYLQLEVFHIYII